MQINWPDNVDITNWTAVDYNDRCLGNHFLRHSRCRALFSVNSGFLNLSDGWIWPFFLKEKLFAARCCFPILGLLIFPWETVECTFYIFKRMKGGNIHCFWTHFNIQSVNMLLNIRRSKLYPVRFIFSCQICVKTSCRFCIWSLFNLLRPSSKLNSTYNVTQQFTQSFFVEMSDGKLFHSCSPSLSSSSSFLRPFRDISIAARQ